MESVKSRIEEKIKGNEAFGESWTGFLKANAEYVEYCHKQGKKPKDVLPYVTNLLENAARRDKSGLPNPLEQKPGFFKRMFSKKDKEEEKKLETLRQELQKVQSVALKNPDIVKDCLSAVEKGKSIPFPPLPLYRRFLGKGRKRIFRESDSFSGVDFPGIFLPPALFVCRDGKRSCLPCHHLQSIFSRMASTSRSVISRGFCFMLALRQFFMMNSKSLR